MGEHEGTGKLVVALVHGKGGVEEQVYWQSHGLTQSAQVLVLPGDCSLGLHQILSRFLPLHCHLHLQCLYPHPTNRNRIFSMLYIFVQS